MAEARLARACGFATMLLTDEKNHLGTMVGAHDDDEEEEDNVHGANNDDVRGGFSSGASSPAEAMSQLWLGDLERKGDAPSATTLTGILARGNAVHLAMEHLRTSLPSGLAPIALQASMRTICTLMRYALVDGGPGRAFTPTDVRVVLRDIEALQEFNAKTLGLSSMDLEWNLNSTDLYKVLDLMTFESAELVMLMSEMLERGQMVDSLLMRVICHRRDRAVSKQLRRRFNLPKM